MHFLLVLLLACTFHTPVLADHPVHVFINTDIILDPDNRLENSTLVIRNGVVVDVGNEIEIPEDARIWDLSGKIISPGWIDMFLPVSRLKGEKQQKKSETKEGSKKQKSSDS